MEVTVLRAVFVRTLKPGVTYEQFKEAWAPEDMDTHYPAKVSIGHNVTNDRQVITILELDVSPSEFQAMAGTLVRPDALDRIAELTESTELEGIFEEVPSLSSP